MLFNSYEFIFGFLPVTLAILYAIGRFDHPRLAMAWVVGASLFFYGWWNLELVTLILFSIFFNYGLGLALGRRQGHAPRWQLVVGVAVNLLLLGFFKYANFFVDNVNAVAGTSFHLGTIILPLAISFFTFQQIAYLVDAYRGEVREQDFLRYCLFVTFFPQLIAGPIVHHKEMLPQFARNDFYRFKPEQVAVGLTIFIFGLFKKVGLADSVAPFSTKVFTAVEAGLAPSLLEAWGAALAYSLQLYFDFSGYSDMAIGLGLLFGIRLPVNFDSPYKAHSIIDFWRRWHMTLSRFLRDYLYFALGGNQKGAARRYVNLVVTMLLGGLWHGAGWTFLAWGALHALYLFINHTWRAWREAMGWQAGRWGVWGKAASRTVTFLAVVVAWVMFRAETFGGAQAMLEGMAGLNAVGDSKSLYFKGLSDFLQLALLLIAVFVLPNTLEIMRYVERAPDRRIAGIEAWLQSRIRWTASSKWAVCICALAFLSFALISETSEFLYYQF